MGKGSHLGDLEELILLAVARLGQSADGAHVRETLQERAGRSEGEVMAILVQAHELRENPERSEGASSNLELMRKLTELVEGCARMS